MGHEVRQARLDDDLSQAVASSAIGMSKSAWSRLERGEALRLPLLDLARAAAAVGLDLSIRAYPGGQPVRDIAHLQLLERFRAVLGPGTHWQTEVPLPIGGDQRAWDAHILAPGARIGIEAETRARDAQGLQRRLALKRRDGGVDHVVLLLADTRHDRAFVRAAGAGFMADFPVPGRAAMARLSAGQDPLGSAVVLL